MTQRQSFYVILIHAAVGVVIIVAAAVLTGLHDLEPAAFTAILGTVAGMVGLSGIQFGQAALNGGPKTDMVKLAQVSPNLAQQMMDHAYPPSPPAEPQQQSSPSPTVNPV